MRFVTTVFLASIMMPTWAQACMSSYDTIEVHYPRTSAPLPVNGGIWVERLDTSEALMDLYQNDVLVPTEVRRFSTMEVLVPLEPLIEGETYEVRAEDGWVVWEGEAVEAVLDPAPVLAGSRTVWAEYELTDGTPNCPGTGPYTSSGVSFTVCNPDAFLVSVIALEEPPEPSFDDGITWATTRYDHTNTTSEAGWSNAVAESEAIVWLGSVNQAGVFSGWTQEEVVLPASDTRRTDEADGYDRDIGSGGVCPAADAPWILGNPTGNVPTGCAVSGSSPTYWAWGLLIVLLRRRDRR